MTSNSLNSGGSAPQSAAPSGSAPQSAAPSAVGYPDFFTYTLDHEDNALSDTQLRQILNDDRARVIAVHELQTILAKGGNMNDVLGPEGYAVLLYEWELNNGHYIALIRHPKGYIEIWDSFGRAPEVQLSTNFQFNHPDAHLLDKLIAKTPGLNAAATQVNRTQFQQMTKASQVCGRYATFRLLHRDLNMAEFNRRLAGVRKHMKVDDFMTLITDLHVRYNK